MEYHEKFCELRLGSYRIAKHREKPYRQREDGCQKDYHQNADRRHSHPGELVPCMSGCGYLYCRYLGHWSVPC